MDKNFYINDLKARYSGHTFTETVTGSLTQVEFKNGSVVSSKSTMDIVDAYRNIRETMLGPVKPLFLSTTTERDALTMTAFDAGIQILNTTAGAVQTYNGSSWV